MAKKKDNPSKAIIFTDLDGSLLDHNTYSFDEAKIALRKIHSLEFPLIFVTSKTSSEVQALSEEMGVQHPMICENGCVLVIPSSYFKGNSNKGEYELKVLGSTYQDIISILNTLKNQNRFQFEGFNDWSVDQVCEKTGLNEEDAEQAKRRMASEPISWMDDNESLREFEKQLEMQGLTLTKGGRFYHVMGKCSKGLAVNELLAMYRENGFYDFHTIGLGDSENDISFLNVVDFPYVLRKIDGGYLENIMPQNTYYSKRIGPAGWQESIFEYLGQMGIK